MPLYKVKTTNWDNTQTTYLTKAKNKKEARKLIKGKKGSLARVRDLKKNPIIVDHTKIIRESTETMGPKFPEDRQS